MRQLSLFFAILLTCNLRSQESIGVWRIGPGIGLAGNQCRLSGGDPTAHAQFQRNNFGSGNFGITGRFDFTKRWMLSVGLGITSYGFEYALSAPYPAGGEKRFLKTSSSTAMLETPLMIHYKFNPNCRDRKWVLGLGLVQSMMGGSTGTGYLATGNESDPARVYVKDNSTFRGGFYPMLRFSVGNEKVFRAGGILNISFVVNRGFSPVAVSKVEYRIDGTTYTHEYTNDGNFAGMRLVYFFRPWNPVTK